MADFRSVLRAVGQGDMDVDILRERIEIFVENNPEYTNEMLQQLGQSYKKSDIDKELYDALVSHINSVIDSNVYVEQADLDLDIAAALKLPQIEREQKAAVSDQTSVTSPPELQGHKLGVGDVIRGRFKITGMLGSGGMGKVYRGIDLIKQEARDKNPYVAIKLLKDDFIDKPESFVALQREASRQQKLSHPNIAAVYDFDRIGSSSDQVFIIMEMLEGESLDLYISRTVRPAKGLRPEDAIAMIKSLGSALAYANSRNIVHSDFKPANSFLCKDGTVKVFDFGIARVIGCGEDIATTIYDPAASFHALTPAYASPQILSHAPSEPGDDVYALGCVAYELLTGNHPYNKLPPTAARERGMTPPNIKGLKYWQNQVLARAVAFGRSERYSNVQDFIDELEYGFKWKKPWLVVTAAVLIATAIGAYPVMQYLHNREINTVITQIKTGEDSHIDNFLQRMPDFGKEDRSFIITEGAQYIQSHLQQRLLATIDLEMVTHNQMQAATILRQAEDLYPGSTWLERLRVINRDIRVFVLRHEINASIGKLVKLSAFKDIEREIMEYVKLAPDNELLQRLAAVARPLVADEMRKLALVKDNDYAEFMYANYARLLKYLKLEREYNLLKGILANKD